MDSIWNAVRSDDVVYPELTEERQVDVVVVGGGITGLSTAYRLTEAGRSVAVIEALKVGCGSTGRSTGNLYGTVSQGLAAIQHLHGLDVLREVVLRRLEAVDYIEKLVTDLTIDCQFTRCPMHLGYRTNTTELSHKLYEEFDASTEAGMDAVLVDEIQGLPFSISRAVELKNQARFNPQSYVDGLAKALLEKDCLIFENSPITNVNPRQASITTLKGKVVARDIVYATHTPKGVNLLQAEMEVYQEYGISARLRHTADAPEGMLWLFDDSRSLRSYQHDGVPYLVVVGEKHKTGHGTLGKGYYDKLEAFAEAHFNVAAFEHRWTAQQYRPADQLPYIGRSGHDNVYVATGFASDGLTWGTVASDIIARKILDQERDADSLFNPRRFTPLKSGKVWLSENATVAKQLLKGLLATSHKKTDLNHIEPGTGQVVNIKGDNLAVYRSMEDELSVLSAECPHMKCPVTWNPADATWDCPCHGSRFSAQGEFIEGPAFENLQRRTLEE